MLEAVAVAVVVLLVEGDGDDAGDDRLRPTSSSVRLLKSKMEAMVVTMGSITVPFKPMMMVGCGGWL